MASQGGQPAPLPPMNPMMGNPTQPAMPTGGISDFQPSIPQAASPLGLNDPVLTQLLGSAGDVPALPPFSPNKIDPPRPSFADIEMAAISDKTYWSGRNERISRDIMIYRQHESGVPTDFDDEYDTRFIIAAMSNLVNRLSNMMAGLDPTIEAPYRDEQTEDDSQAIENFGYWSRNIDRRLYARSTSGNLQRDEFFFLLLHGAIAVRVLPDVNDSNYPFSVSLLDPSTVYPTFGGPKDGLVRVTRRYTQKIAQLVSEYSGLFPKVTQALFDRFGADAKGDYNQFLNHEVEVIEYYDTKYRAIYTSDGIEIMPVMEHGYDFVPFVYVTAVGEPSAMQTPGGRYVTVDNRGGTLARGVSIKEELREKGVSVLHYLINTHRLKEAIYTLLYAEIEKAGNPPTMRYRAPQLMDGDIPDIDYHRGMENAAFLGLEKVEGLPTSPRPTDVAPTLQVLDQDFMAGSLNPAATGGEMGANASGYALDTLIASAKELILPYLQAFENYLSLQLEMKLRFYEQIIADMVPLSVPNNPLYGSANAMTDLTVEGLRRVGVSVVVKMKNISDQNLPMRAQTATMLMQAGLYSQRAGMDYIGVPNPDKMFADILAEKALQHPMIQDLFAIPGALKARGADELAQIWASTVGMQALMASGLMQQPGQAPPDQGGGGANTPPPRGGAPDQAAGAANAGAPTGPLPGQGRQ